MPFKSEKQRRWMHANKPEMAAEWEKEEKRKKRNYRREYDRYQGRPEQVARRSMRNKARRKYEKAHGNVPSDMDVDHRIPLVKGGRNPHANLRVLSRNANRSFKRTRRARMA